MILMFCWWIFIPLHGIDTFLKDQTILALAAYNLQASTVLYMNQSFQCQ